MGRMAAGCWPDEIEVPARSSFIFLTVEDMLSGRFTVVALDRS